MEFNSGFKGLTKYLITIYTFPLTALYRYCAAVPVLCCCTGIVLLYRYCAAVPVLCCCTSIVLLYRYCAAVPVLCCCTGIVLLHRYCAAAPVLCCCTKHQQISTAVLLHQMSVLATSLRSVDRTNVASSTNRPQSGGVLGGRYRRYLSDKIMPVFPKYRQLIQYIPIQHTDCDTDCCCSAGNCAASQSVTVSIGWVLCCVVS